VVGYRRLSDWPAVGRHQCDRYVSTSFDRSGQYCSNRLLYCGPPADSSTVCQDVFRGRMDVQTVRCESHTVESHTARNDSVSLHVAGTCSRSRGQLFCCSDRG
jgi:hypothetical protein